MTQHASLSPERWSAFSFDQQILMIGNEMNRAVRLVRPADRASLALAYERTARPSPPSPRLPFQRRREYNTRSLVGQ
jgi:hypothetical protein